MIILKLTGGLGNQMFQYAMGRRLAERHRTELLLDASGYGPNGEQRPENMAAFKRPLRLFSFRVKARVAKAEEIAALRDDYFRATTRDRIVRQVRKVSPNFLRRKSHVHERQYRFQPEALTWPDNLYLQGFWQSPKYFEDIAPIIREELQPADASILESAKEAVEKLRRRFSAVISLHVRRGDIAHAHEVLGRKDIAHGAPVSTDYLSRAMEKFEPEAGFFVFSDSPKDIEWCRNNIKAKNVEFSKAESDIWDFTAMGLCDHHIIANSTFSWWAAWLNANPKRRVIAPKVWSPPETKFRMETEDLLPASWVVQ
jgi:Glycosyl transferase family 11